MPGRPYRYIHVHAAAWRHRIVKRASIVVTIVSLRHYSKTIVQHNETYGRMSRESSPPSLCLSLSFSRFRFHLPSSSFFICFSYLWIKFCGVMPGELGHVRFYHESCRRMEERNSVDPTLIHGGPWDAYSEILIKQFRELAVWDICLPRENIETGWIEEITDESYVVLWTSPDCH